MKAVRLQQSDRSPPLAERQIVEPQKNSIHMICAPKSSALDYALRSKISVSATASIIGYRMKDVDWGFVLTSDI